MIPLVFSIRSAAAFGARPPPAPAGPVRGRGAAARMLASSSAGWVPLVIWAAAVDPADVPMIRSASVTSSPASNRPAMTPISHALPADPPPPRTSARSPAARERPEASACWPALGRSPCPGASIAAAVNPSRGPSPATARRALETSPAMPSEVVVEVKCGAEEDVVFMGVAFRELPVGRSRWRLPQSRDRGRQGSTHCGYCVHGSHLLPMDHDRRDGSTPATRRATGIMPAAVSLSNAPPTATPSSVMSRFQRSWPVSGTTRTGHGAWRSTCWLTGPSTRAAGASLRAARTISWAPASRAAVISARPGSPAIVR